MGSRCSEHRASRATCVHDLRRSRGIFASLTTMCPLTRNLLQYRVLKTSITRTTSLGAYQGDTSVNVASKCASRASRLQGLYEKYWRAQELDILPRNRLVE